MNAIKKQLIEHIELGYDFNATAELIAEGLELQEAGVRRYHVTLPPWWRKGVIAMFFLKKNNSNL